MAPRTGGHGVPRPARGCGRPGRRGGPVDLVLTREIVAGGLILLGFGIAVGVARALLQRRHDRVYGELVAADRAGSTDRPIVSREYRIAGRPDSVRRLPDGRE